METTKGTFTSHREDNTPEKYQLKLKEKIELIEEAIQNVSKLRKDLNENSKNVKIEVQKSISFKVEEMRQREMQLIRQIDALIGHQSARLQLHLSHLYQTLGSFKAASQWVDLGSQVFKLPTLNEEDLETVSPCLIRYQLDDDKLALAIHSFGSLEAKGTPAKVFLLPEEEEYGDGDHHVLHKTLQEELSQTKIKVAFPKLNGKLDDWLPPASNIKTLQDLELNSSRSSISEVSDSIEMVSHSDLHENQEWLQSFKTVGSLCNCQDLGNVEIENLDSLSCIPNTTYQVTTKQSDEIFLPLPPIATICKSNASEKCCSYETCLCENNCLFENLKERLISMEIQDALQQQDCINTAIKNNFSKQWLYKLDEQIFTDQKWLASISKPKGAGNVLNEEWLPKQNLPVYKESSKPFEFPPIFKLGDLSMWLQKTGSTCKEESSEKIDETKEKSTICSNKLEESWLCENNKLIENSFTTCNKNKLVNSTFDMNLKPFDNKSWLLKSCNPCVKDRSG